MLLSATKPFSHSGNGGTATPESGVDMQIYGVANEDGPSCEAYDRLRQVRPPRRLIHYQHGCGVFP